MNGLITLVGSGEYLPVMDDIDRYLLESTKVNSPRVVCLPTAAGSEGDETINRWSRMGVEHFQNLGADVTALRIIDKDSANDEQFVPLIENANLIYFSGGNPNYLYETMNGSRAWTAMQKAWSNGAIYAGCSAGAMILANRIPSFRLFGTIEGFGIIPAQFILPHFDAVPVMFKPLITALKSQLKDGEHMVGIDEDTAIIGTPNGEWKVMGRSKAHIFSRKGNQSFENGQTFSLNGTS